MKGSEWPDSDSSRHVCKHHCTSNMPPTHWNTLAGKKAVRGSRKGSVKSSKGSGRVKERQQREGQGKAAGGSRQRQPCGAAHQPGVSGSPDPVKIVPRCTPVGGRNLPGASSRAELRAQSSARAPHRGGGRWRRERRGGGGGRGYCRWQRRERPHGPLLEQRPRSVRATASAGSDHLVFG